MVKLLFFSGSTREESLNQKLARLAYDIAKAQGVDAEAINLADYPMPLYDGDDESRSGLPENAKKLKEIFRESGGFFIASPEYNGSFSGVLKNSIDWVSRSEGEGEPPAVVFQNKVVALSSVSPGGLGGLRGLIAARMLLGNMGITVIAEQITVPNGNGAFDESGALTDARHGETLRVIVGKLARAAALPPASG